MVAEYNKWGNPITPLQSALFLSSLMKPVRIDYTPASTSTIFHIYQNTPEV